MKNVLFLVAVCLIILVGCAGQQDQVGQTNMVVAQRYVNEIWNQGNLEAAGELLTADFMRHNPPSIQPTDVQGMEEFKSYVTGVRERFPDFNVTIEASVVKGDMGAARWVITGTDAETGKAMELWGLSFTRYTDGKIAEEWAIWDTYEAMQQTGMIEMPEMSAQ